MLRAKLIDDWGMGVIDSTTRSDLLEMFDDRTGCKTTIITSQLPIEHWHAWIGDVTIADAILDIRRHRSWENIFNFGFFDLSIFNVTDLPILIHDFLFFKNIDNRAVADIIHKYFKIKKQLLIAIDEIKNGIDAELEMLDSKIIDLSNTELLYEKGWRKHKSGPDA